MAKYQADVQTLLRAIGGRENIQAVSHCMTRMRFVLADPAKADTAAIEAIPAVKGTFTQAGQFQVIIGNDVAIFYNEFTACAGIEGVSKDAVKAAAQTNQSLLQRIMGTLGEIFAPIIPALICGGLILGFRNIIGEINFLGGGTQSLADVSQFWAGMYSFLWLIGEAVFHMLPVGIVWSITKKMGTTQILGIILGLTLVSPQLLNGFSVATTAVEDIPVWDFGFVQIQMIGYQGQVIAAMLAGFVLVYLEKFFKKICPEVVSMIVVPFCSLVPAVLVAHTIVGPIGWQIGDAIASVVYAGLTSNVRWLFAALFGLLYAPIVMTGLHHMTNAIDSQLVNLYGGTNLWPMIALSNIAQGSAVLAMSVLQKKNERAQQVNIPACISCYLGVTEPALFGVNLKYGFPLVCGMIGSACGAVISIGTRHDRLRLRGGHLHRHRRGGLLHRCGRPARDSVHQAPVLAELPHRHAGGRRGALCPDHPGGQPEAVRRRPGAERDFRGACGPLRRPRRRGTAPGGAPRRWGGGRHRPSVRPGHPHGGDPRPGVLPGHPGGGGGHRAHRQCGSGPRRRHRVLRH